VIVAAWRNINKGRNNMAGVAEGVKVKERKPRTRKAYADTVAGKRRQQKKSARAIASCISCLPDDTYEETKHLEFLLRLLNSLTPEEKERVADSSPKRWQELDIFMRCKVGENWEKVCGRDTEEISADAGELQCPAVRYLKRTTCLNSVILTWREPVRVLGNPTTGYTVRVFEINDRVTTDVTDQVQVDTISDTGTGSGSGTASVTIMGLSTWTQYRFEVRAITGELGLESAVAAVKATTINPTKYPVVTRFKAAIDRNMNAITLSWAESKVSDTIGYEVVVRDAAGEERKFDVAPGVGGVTVSDRDGVMLPPITDLDVGKYTFFVRAVTDDGVKSATDAKKTVTLR
jgi:hypothetical protein